MVEIKIIENEERNEYLIEPYQAFLGARYDNLSDEIKVTFPKKEIDNGSSCTMIITNGDEPIDCVTVYNDKVFKLESPATQYKQVFIGFSFQKADGYIKNTNAGLFFFRGAQPPDVSVPTTPIQREKINLLLAEGLAGVRVAEDDPATMEFTNVDGEPIGEFTAPKGEDGKSVHYIKFSWGYLAGVPTSSSILPVSYFGAVPKIGDLGISTDGVLFEATGYFNEHYVNCVALTSLKGSQGEQGEKGDKGDAGSIKFIPVATLPTENIDESAIYLVPIEGAGEENRFTEYVYIDGKWEVIGAITVQVDHSEYVKFTDFDEQTIESLTDNARTLTDEEKASACGWLGCIPIIQFEKGRNRIYICKPNGELQVVETAAAGAIPSGYAIPIGTSAGNIAVATPTADTHATNKQYVDDLIAELRAEIEALKG